MERLTYQEYEGTVVLMEDHRNIVQSEQKALFSRTQRTLETEEHSGKVLVDLTGVRFSPLLLEETAKHLKAIKSLGAKVAVLGSLGFDNIFYTATSLVEKDYPYFCDKEDALDYLVK